VVIPKERIDSTPVRHCDGIPNAEQVRVVRDLPRSFLFHLDDSVVREPNVEDVAGLPKLGREILDHASRDKGNSRRWFSGRDARRQQPNLSGSDSDDDQDHHGCKKFHDFLR